MNAPRRRCLRCGTLTDGASYCPPHDLRRRGSTARGYGAAYQAARRALLAAAPVCWLPDCDQPATTADHQPPLRSFASPELWRGELRPACRRHNDGHATAPMSRSVVDSLADSETPNDPAGRSLFVQRPVLEPPCPDLSLTNESES